MNNDIYLTIHKLVYVLILSTFFLMLGKTSPLHKYRNFILLLAHFSIRYVLISYSIITNDLALDSTMTLLNSLYMLLRTKSHFNCVLKNHLLQNMGGVFIIYLNASILTTLIPLISLSHACGHVDLAAFHLTYFNKFSRIILPKVFI